MANIIDFEQQQERKRLQEKLAQQDDAERFSAIMEMNKRHAVITVGGNTCIMNFDTNPDTGHRDYSFSNEKQFNLRYRDRLVTSERGKLTPLSKAWLASPARQLYEGLVFRPGHCGNIGDHFNFWHGYQIHPDAQRDCEEFLSTLKDVCCSGDDALLDYVLDWIADLFQRPTEKPGVALVFRGNRGTGKTFLAEMLAEILGPYYFKAAHARHVTGNFNFHLMRLQLLFIEEAFWAGDKQAESVMKDLITGRTLTIEPKGLPVIQARSYARVMMASNEDFAAPAGPEERRYAVFDVADTYKQDWQHFARLRKQMTQEGGLSAFLHRLLTRDLSVDLRNVPKTDALLEQKLHHLDALARWWLQTLERGTHKVYSEDERGRMTVDYIHWDEYISKANLHESYLQFCKDHGINGYRMDRQLFFKTLRKRMSYPRKTPLDLRESNANTVRRVKMPGLSECRKAFDRYLGQSYAWVYEIPS